MILKHLFKFTFLLYCFFLLFVTQLPLNLVMIFKGAGEVHCNFIPFRFLLNAYAQLNVVNQNGFNLTDYLLPTILNNVKNFIQNIIIFIPMGFFLPNLFTKITTVTKTFIMCFLISMGIELLQLFGMLSSLQYGRVLDVDDLLANSLGGVIGFALYLVYTNRIKPKMITAAK